MLREPLELAQESPEVLREVVLVHCSHQMKKEEKEEKEEKLWAQLELRILVPVLILAVKAFSRNLLSMVQMLVVELVVEVLVLLQNLPNLAEGWKLAQLEFPPDVVVTLPHDQSPRMRC